MKVNLRASDLGCSDLAKRFELTLIGFINEKEQKGYFKSFNIYSESWLNYHP